MTYAARARRLLSIGLAMALVAACSAQPGMSAAAEATVISPTAAATAPAATAPPSGAPTATVPPSPSASQSTSGRATISPSDVPHADPSLEALLPARIGDVELIRMSAPGAQYDTGGDVCSFVCPLEARLMAEGVGAEVDDVTLAFAFDAAVERYGLVAFSVAGASGSELRDARLAMLDSEAPYPFIAERPVGDDTVTVAIRSWFPNDTHFLVVREDALIVIRYPTPMHDGAEPELPPEVATIVAALP